MFCENRDFQFILILSKDKFFNLTLYFFRVQYMTGFDGTDYTTNILVQTWIPTIPQKVFSMPMYIAQYLG